MEMTKSPNKKPEDIDATPSSPIRKQTIGSRVKRITIIYPEKVESLKNMVIMENKAEENNYYIQERMKSGSQESFRRREELHGS